jgi:hypothetical protein
MVAGTDRSRKAGVLAALLMLIFVVIVGIDAYQKIRRQSGPPSTYNTRSAGYKALYLWLRELGVSAERWEKPLTELTREADVLVMISPRLGSGSDELKALETWIRDGGTLISISSPLDPFARQLVSDLRVRDHDRKEAGHKGSSSFQPGPYIRGQRTILSKMHLGVDSPKPETILHARDAFGNLILVEEQVNGRVITVSDPSLFSNLYLRSGDHARLALDILLTHLGKGQLLFDEYHHGYSRSNSVAAYVFQSEALVPLLQIVFLVLLVWGAAGRRFGPARPLRREMERSSMEYVRAVAQLFQRVKARRLALENVLRWFDEETRRLLLDKDPVLQKEMAEAKKQVPLETMTDRDLVSVVRKLYGALARARKHGL